MRHRFLISTAGALLVAGLSACSLAWNAFPTTRFTADGSDVLVEGTLNAHTLEQFQEFMAEHPETERLVLMYVPGSVDDDTNLQFGHLVRDLGLDTYLTADSEVHSGGTDLFLAGVERTMERGAIIGVHTWAEGRRAGVDFPREDPVHDAYEDYTRRMLGSAAFYWFTLEAAPIDGSHALSEREIETFGLLTQPILEN